VDFEDPPLGTQYKVPDTFTDSGVKISVGPFQWSNGQWTSNGYAQVEGAGLAGGAGQDIQVNNVNLSFDFYSPIESLSLRFGEYGGNLNININGTLVNFENFSGIDGQNIGGVHRKPRIVRRDQLVCRRRARTVHRRRLPVPVERQLGITGTKL